jgi:hypothetical protein
VHNTANQLNLIMGKTTQKNPRASILFRFGLILAFVARPPSMLAVMNSVPKRIPQGSHTRSKINNPLCDPVYTNKSVIRA